MMLSWLERPFAGIFQGIPVGWQAVIERAYIRLLSLGIGELPDARPDAAEVEATRALSIIVPVHNAPRETRRCLDALERFAGHAEVILVDDGSTDADARSVVLEYACRNGWKRHRNEAGSYHSGACTDGVRLATRPILCLLNSDTVVTQCAWSLSIRALQKPGGPIAVVPGMSAGPGSQSDVRAWRCRRAWNDATIFAYAAYRRRRFGARSARRARGFLGGAAFFVRRTDWDRVGGFSGCRAHYGNDVDLCAKLVAGGGWLGVCDGDYIHHLAGCSSAASAQPAGQSACG